MFQKDDKVAFKDDEGNPKEGIVQSVRRGNGPFGWAMVAENGKIHSRALTDLEKIDNAPETETA